MKKFTFNLIVISFLSLAVALLLSFTFSTENQTQKIGYLDSKGKFISVNNTQLTNFFKKTNHLKETAVLENLSVKDVIEKESGKKVYILIAKYKEEGFSIKIGSSLKKIGEQEYALVGKTCSCKSKSCATTVGCDVYSTSPCLCSPCNGDCEKTSSSTEEDEIGKFF